MRTVTFGIIVLVQALISVSLAADLPDQVSGAVYGAPSLIGEWCTKMAPPFHSLSYPRMSTLWSGLQIEGGWLDRGFGKES